MIHLGELRLTKDSAQSGQDTTVLYTTSILTKLRPSIITTLIMIVSVRQPVKQTNRKLHISEFLNQQIFSLAHDWSK